MRQVRECQRSARIYSLVPVLLRSRQVFGVSRLSITSRQQRFRLCAARHRFPHVGPYALAWGLHTVAGLDQERVDGVFPVTDSRHNRGGQCHRAGEQIRRQGRATVNSSSSAWLRVGHRVVYIDAAYMVGSNTSRRLHGYDELREKCCSLGVATPASCLNGSLSVSRIIPIMRTLHTGSGCTRGRRQSTYVPRVHRREIRRPSANPA